jgi:hypothetical protein
MCFVPTGEYPEDCNLAGVEVLQWVLLYISIAHDTVAIIDRARLTCV